MTFLYYDKQDFYKGMLDLQAKLRKSEDERIRLEERFKLLVQESQNRHDACINRLRLRYIEFLEEQRDREDRNNKLRGALDKVDSHLALMTAKSNRLNALRKHYEAYLLQTYGNQHYSGSLTGDSGVISQHDDRYFRKDLISQNRRHSIQSVSIPPSTPTTNFPSRIVTPTLPKYREPRFLDPPNIQQANLLLYHQQPIYSDPKMGFKQQPQVLSSLTPRIPEIRISPSFSPTFVSKNVQTDKPINLHLDQSVISMEPCQISGIGRISQVSSYQALPQFTNQFSRQVTPSPQIDNISQYLYNVPLPKPNNLLQETSPRSQTEVPDFPLFKNRSTTFENTASLASTYPDYSWRSVRGSRFEEKIPKFEKSIFERNSRVEDKSPRRFFRRFDFNTTFKRNDHPLPSSKDILNSSRLKSWTSFKPTTTFKSDYDVSERSKRMNSEIDRYIGKIRNLYKDLDIQSFEDLDHEQNTSGDLLNVTLSDDDIDIPVEDKTKEAVTEKKDVPENFAKPIETPRVSHAANPLTVTDDVSISETRCPVSLNKENVTSVVTDGDEINSGIKKEETEILEENENTNIELVNSDVNNADSPLTEKERERKNTESNDQEIDQKLDEKEEEIAFEGEEKNVESSKTAAKNEVKKKEKREERENENQQEDVKQIKENQDFVQDQPQEYQYNSNQNYNYDPNTVYEQYPTYHTEIYEQFNQEYDPNQDPSQYTQDANQYSKDTNQQYEQDPNQQYEQDPNKQYKQDPNQQYEQDPNQQYDTTQYSQDPNQYSQDPNQQYEQDHNQQYDPTQYPQDLNHYNQDLNQYNKDPDQYGQDSNQSIDQDPSHQQYAQEPTQDYAQNSKQYDPNQQYQDPNIQYDPNQQYRDPNIQYDPNQTYDPSQCYDPNQAYVYSQSQEYSQDQSYAQQDQAYNSDQPYDENYTSEAIIEQDGLPEVVAQEKKADNVETNAKKQGAINLESDTESTIERNASNTESDFDFN